MPTPTFTIRSPVSPGDGPPETRLQVFLNTAPLVEWQLFREGRPGQAEPFGLETAAVAFYKKPRNSDPDPEPLYSTAAGGIAITSGPGGIVAIQFDAADLTRPGQFRYHLDAVRSGQRTVLAWGPLTILAR